MALFTASLLKIQDRIVEFPISSSRSLNFNSTVSSEGRKKIKERNSVESASVGARFKTRQTNRDRDRRQTVRQVEGSREREEKLES